MNNDIQLDFSGVSGFGSNPVVPADLSDIDLSNQNVPVTELTNGNNGTIINPNSSSTTSIDVTPQSDTVASEDSDNTESGDTSGNSDDDFSGYTQPALFAKLLAENNLDMFGEEIPKDLDPETFVSKFHETASNVIQSKLSELEEIEQYVRYKLSGGPDEYIDPAIQAEQYANFNINDPTVTEKQLEILVGQMYFKQGVPQDLIENLVNVDKEKGVLAEKADLSVKFHRKFIDDTVQNATIKYQQDVEAENARLRTEASKFANQLKETKQIGGIVLTDNDRAELFDYHHKRDQLVKFTDPATGKPQQEYVTKYELMMYQAVNTPETLIKLTYLLKNGLDINSDGKFANNLKRNINQSLLNAIDANKDKVNNTIKNTEPVRSSEQLFNISTGS